MLDSFSHDKLDRIQMATVLKDTLEDLLLCLQQPPVLIGGTAVVRLGADEASLAFELAVNEPDETLRILYRNGFKLVSAKIKRDDGKMEYQTFGDVEDAIAVINEHKPPEFKAVNAETGEEINFLHEIPIAFNELLFASELKEVFGLGIPVAAEEHRSAIHPAVDPKNQEL